MNTLAIVIALMCLLAALLLMRSKHYKVTHKWLYCFVLTAIALACFIHVYAIIAGVVCTIAAFTVMGILVTVYLGKQRLS
ncbi:MULTISPECIES: hypothetical protein [Pseudoalteromonas]|uniref:Uncharacterized protein n=1 Tax=Pseudoalteromonas undina TaxID=43660 RepID=A0ACC6R1P3_9GAMM|nr:MULTISPECIES: hypothetical protein [unclassified Pseudoalteromonas]KPZ57193.1 hypothetical protein AN393_00911 [Pseudoalteromonas sp. P1-25]KPZ59388.1 hypothetical protein AN391_01095 [Pseudoalteromonas sp. P1-13-1a]KPZ59973.1 hypothetical protein AN389_02505 [Pseudoalteromonas sp. P1-7a]